MLCWEPSDDNERDQLRSIRHRAGNESKTQLSDCPAAPRKGKLLTFAGRLRPSATRNIATSPAGEKTNDLRPRAVGDER